MIFFGLAEILILIRGIFILLFFYYFFDDNSLSIFTQFIVISGIIQSIGFFSSTRSIERDLPNLSYKRKKELFISYFYFLIKVFCCILIFIIILKIPIEKFFFKNLNPQFVLILIIVNSFNLFLNNIIKTWLRVSNQNKKLLKLRSKIFFSNLLSIVIIYSFNLKIFYSILIIVILEFLINFISILSNKLILKEIRRKLFIRRTINYSFKSYPYALFIIYIFSFDKIIITYFFEFSVIGKYYLIQSTIGIFSLLILNTLTGYYLSESVRNYKNKTDYLDYNNETTNLLIFFFTIINFFIITFMTDIYEYALPLLIDNLSSLELLFIFFNLNNFLIAFSNIITFIYFMNNINNLTFKLFLISILYTFLILIINNSYNLVGLQFVISISLILYSLLILFKIKENININVKFLIISIIFIYFTYILNTKIEFRELFKYLAFIIFLVSYVFIFYNFISLNFYKKFIVNIR